MSEFFYLFAGNLDESGQSKIGMDYYRGTFHTPEEALETAKEFLIGQLVSLDEDGNLTIIAMKDWAKLRGYFWNYNWRDRPKVRIEAAL